jgi:mycothiol synthase
MEKLEMSAIYINETITTSSLPEGYSIRPAKMEDLEEAVAVFNATSRSLIGVEKYPIDVIRMEWQEPGFNQETDARVVTSAQGKIVAYGEVWDVSDPHVDVYCWGRVHPDYTGIGLGSALLAWQEERARQALDKAPPEARVVMTCAVPSIDKLSQDLLQDTGFTLIRHGLRMVIELNEHPPEAKWPDGISMRTFQAGDERAMLHAVRDAFKDHWGYVEHPFEVEYEQWLHYMQNSPDFDPNLCFLAMDGDEIAGISICEPKAHDDEEMGWVGILGVRRPWRRMGLGLALLHHSFGEFFQRGKRKAGLGVDAKSLTGATRLYTKAGMHPDPKHEYSIFEKELRAGVDIRTQVVRD